MAAGSLNTIPIMMKQAGLSKGESHAQVAEPHFERPSDRRVASLSATILPESRNPRVPAIQGA